MYRIMLAKSKQPNFASLYQFLTANINGKISPVEIETKEALDAMVEEMLNDIGYSKNDFIVVQVVDYTIDAKDYTDESTAPTENNQIDNTQEEPGVVENGEGQ